MAKRLIDTALIQVSAGNGGDGKLSLRREKYIPKGGPDGGNGGNGGDVYFIADHNLATLADFKSKPKYQAQHGEEGGKNVRQGGNGEDLYISVPVGTLIYEVREKDLQNGETAANTNQEGSADEVTDFRQRIKNVETTQVLVADFTEHGQKLLIAHGGRGGRGNDSFKSSTNQTPMQFTRGTLGQSKTIKLEVKIIADIGFVGLPNAGKSTLVNSVTNANAKVDSYPFTTIFPNLGFWELKSGESVIVADIPGLIEGASTGKGLGDEFLRHIERTRIILHLIDPYTQEISESTALEEEFNSLSEEKALELLESADKQALVKKAIASYNVIRKELEDHKTNLQDKPEIVVINKIDITEVKEAYKSIKEHFEQKFDVKVFGISAVTGEGLEDLEEEVIKMLDLHPKRVQFDVAKPVKVFTIENLPNKRMVFLDNKEDWSDQLDG